MIIGGEIEIYDRPDGFEEDRVLVHLGEGHCFGEMALIYDEPRNASARVVSPLGVECAFLVKEDFRGALNDDQFQEIVSQLTEDRMEVREARDRRLQEAEECWSGDSSTEYSTDSSDGEDVEPPEITADLIKNWQQNRLTRKVCERVCWYVSYFRAVHTCMRVSVYRHLVSKCPCVAFNSNPGPDQTQPQELCYDHQDETQEISRRRRQVRQNHQLLRTAA